MLTPSIGLPRMITKEVHVKLDKTVAEVRSQPSDLCVGLKVYEAPMLGGVGEMAALW
jgi:hypothetical protein